MKLMTRRMELHELGQKFCSSGGQQHSLSQHIDESLTNGLMKIALGKGSNCNKKTCLRHVPQHKGKVIF